MSHDESNVQLSDGTELRVKNTFLDCASSVDDVVVRRSRSAPPKVAMLELTRMPSTPSSCVSWPLASGAQAAPMAVRLSEALSISTDDSSTENTSEDFRPLWPATPEGNFLLKYTNSDDFLPKLDMTPVPSAGSGEDDASSSSQESSRSSVQCARPWTKPLRAGLVLGTQPEKSTSPAASSTALPLRLHSKSRDTRNQAQKAPETPSTTYHASQSMGMSSASSVATISSSEAAARLAKAVAIAQLQELLQSPEHTSRFKFPLGVKVLHWSFRSQHEERQPGETRTYNGHRSVLSFLANGIPHHVAGQREICKKIARQSAAEVALRLLRGNRVRSTEDGGADVCVDLSHVLPSARSIAARSTTAKKDYTRKLQAFLRQCGTVSSTGCSWTCEQDTTTGQWRATVHIIVLGIQHVFVGPLREESANESSSELAQRVLWFLGYKACRGSYVVDRRKWIAVACEVPSALPMWVESLGGEGAERE
mmetsp:Transcript_26817/g.61834  ORF Transcript_26817/g.61834 Transcript_26817/m.61834 type:complete len:480 (-) Transcript_26817:211-1650(-)